jgi:hypothetical protein
LRENLSAANWYTLIAAVLLLGLALLNNPWATVIISVFGIAGGLFLVARGPLARSGVAAFVGFVIAGALAAFSLLWTGR